MNMIIKFLKKINGWLKIFYKKKKHKVYGNDSGSKSDGFEKISALLLSNIRTISQGRLLEKKGN